MLFVGVLPLRREAGAFQKAFPVEDWERGTNYELPSHYRHPRNTAPKVAIPSTIFSVV